ncbi:AzlD domain-containing protein [Vibrio gazogenes]|uniref:Branched-chain amino acid ABC transporter n=1 Tax=Vibrio gazogenes TaxID=687 RepID=A0A1Z2SH28_VIBGA|nr:AzlD domain-containing protein [Vibrio gazogenes]ASA56481.1 hypothetical protein BSQ33_12760 [Vibrio gazogenes]
MTFITILLMAAITFSVRYLFFMTTLPFELSDKAKEFLKFTGPCVLSAMVAPIMFTPVDGLMIYSPYLLGGIATIMISLVLRNTFMIVLLGMTMFLLLKNYI